MTMIIIIIVKEEREKLMCIFFLQQQSMKKVSVTFMYLQIKQFGRYMGNQKSHQHSIFNNSKFEIENIFKKFDQL